MARNPGTLAHRKAPAVKADTLTQPSSTQAPAGTPSRWAWSRLAPYAAAVLSALLLTLANPPMDHGWLAWFALAPFFWTLCAATQHPTLSRPRPFTLGFLHGFAYLFFLVPWFGAFSPIGYPIAAAYWGLLSGLAAIGTVYVLRRCGVAWWPPVLAAGWVLLEWLRAQGTLAFPWGQLAATQYRYLPVLQLLDLTGSYGLSFLMALTAASIALFPVVLQKPAAHRTAITWLALCVAAVAVASGRGAWLLSRPAPPGQAVRVGVVQASESIKIPGAAVVCVSPPAEYDSRTLQALRQGAELVVWPESASEDDARNDPRVRQRLAGLLRGTAAYLLAGSFVQHPEGGLTNAAVMLRPDGQVTATYYKVLIVPFGEYLPLRPLLRWTEALGMPSTDLRAGDRFTPVPWDRGSVGVSICFESAFGGVSREYVRQGANLLAVLTSDGWAGRTAAGRQHAAFAPLRAVENRRSVARAAATGISQLIDPYGRPLQSLPMFERGFLVGELPLRSDRTLYSYLGDWPLGASALLLVLAVVLGRPRRFRRGASEGS